MASHDFHKLAEKIAAVLESESGNPDLAALFASIDKINYRLDKLEKASANPHSAIRNPQSQHPSIEKFSVAEASADEILNGMIKEKACALEPNGKPCDHCAMCSSRGF
jgi:hypothetical protein